MRRKERQVACGFHFIAISRSCQRMIVSGVTIVAMRFGGEATAFWSGSLPLLGVQILEFDPPRQCPATELNILDPLRLGPSRPVQLQDQVLAAIDAVDDALAGGVGRCAVDLRINSRVGGLARWKRTYLRWRGQSQWLKKFRA